MLRNTIRVILQKLSRRQAAIPMKLSGKSTTGKRVQTQTIWVTSQWALGRCQQKEWAAHMRILVSIPVISPF